MTNQGDRHSPDARGSVLGPSLTVERDHADVGLGRDFCWELVTPVEVTLLGHWLKMRSVRQASEALDTLATWRGDSRTR
jgi:hypothetical protein